MQSPGAEAKQNRFSWFAWGVLAFNIPVILWGAYVRVSYSGDGCGAHWPFCNGLALPQNMTKPTVIEFTHRMMSSVDTILVAALVALAFWLYPKRDAVRRYAAASLGFLVIEALLGAGLVIFRKVAHDQSAGRVWYLSAHLTNTMLLLAALTITAWLASGRASRLRILSAPPALLWSALGVIFISVTGTVAALGDMLFPSATLMEGMRQDLSIASPVLLRLRIIHPLIALLGSGFIIWTALTLWKHSGAPDTRRAALRLIAICVFQLFWGAANLSLLAPIWMQLSHLLVADLVWIAMLLTLAESVAPAAEFKTELLTAMAESGRQSTAGNPA